MNVHAYMVKYTAYDVKAKKSVEHALKALNEKNINVLVYPEGTRSRPNDILQFKKGSFILAIQSGLPILPISTILPSFIPIFWLFNSPSI